jgi:hypothetical protein
MANNNATKGWWSDFMVGQKSIVQNESYLSTDGVGKSQEEMAIANMKARREAEIDRQQREIQEYYRQQPERKK